MNRKVDIREDIKRYQETLCYTSSKVDDYSILENIFMLPTKGSVIFYQEGGLLKIGKDQVLCLRSKGGSKDFFKLKRGITYIF